MISAIFMNVGVKSSALRAALVDYISNSRPSWSALNSRNQEHAEKAVITASLEHGNARHMTLINTLVYLIAVRLKRRISHVLAGAKKLDVSVGMVRWVA